MDGRIPPPDRARVSAGVEKTAEAPKSYQVPSDFEEPANLDDLFEGSESEAHDTQLQHKLVSLPSPPAVLPAAAEPSIEDLQARLANLRGGKKIPPPDGEVAARARELLGRVLPELETGFASLPKGPDARTATKEQLGAHMQAFKKAVDGLTQNLQKYANVGVNPKAKLAASGYADLLQSRLRLESQYLGNAAIQGGLKQFPAADVRALQSRAASVGSEASRLTDLRGQLTAQAYNATNSSAARRR